MKLLIYPKKEAVLEYFANRICDAEDREDKDLSNLLRAELELVLSHGPSEVAVELED